LVVRAEVVNQTEDEWPSMIEDMDAPESQEQLKTTANAMVVRVECLPSVANVVDINRHGNLEKLLRVTTWVFRFIRNLRPNQDKNAKRSGRLMKKELTEAEREWLKATQADLQRQKNFQQLKTEMGVAESEGILRCVGRLVNSDLEFDAHRPIVLPRDHAYTTMVTRDCHEKVMHGGVRVILAEVRSKYWITKGRQCVKKNFEYMRNL